MENSAAHNSTYPKGGVSCSKDTFVQAESSVLRMKFSGKSPALRVAANRYVPLTDQNVLQPREKKDIEWLPTLRSSTQEFSKSKSSIFGFWFSGGQ